MLNRSRFLFPFLFCWLALAPAALADPPPAAGALASPAAGASPSPAAGASASPAAGASVRSAPPAPDPLAVHLQRGDAARRTARWADAESAYRAAWEIQRRPDIAGELGASELALGKHRDAAEHLQLSLEQADHLSTDQQRRFREAQRKAEQQVAALTISSYPADAEIFVDDRSVGRPRPSHLVFVDPGLAMVRATLSGHGEVTVRLEVGPGTSHSVSLSLPDPMPAPLLLVTAPAPVPAPVPAPCPDAAGCRHSTLETLRYAGFFATGAGAALGAGLVIAADAVHREAKDRGRGLSPSACSTEPDMPVCGDLQELIQTRDRLAGAAVVTLLVTAGIGGVTVASLWWEPSPERPSTGLRVLPSTSGDRLGVVLDGRW